MRILIAEDDLASRRFISEVLSKYGTCDITVDGVEALDAFLLALDEGSPYQLICLDIMMPKVDGMKALKVIRDIESQKGIEGSNRARVIMTTALNDKEFVMNSFDSGCEAYAAKPIDTQKLVEVMRKLSLIS